MDAWRDAERLRNISDLVIAIIFEAMELLVVEYNVLSIFLVDVPFAQGVGNSDGNAPKLLPLRLWRNSGHIFPSLLNLVKTELRNVLQFLPPSLICCVV